MTAARYRSSPIRHPVIRHPARPRALRMHDRFAVGTSSSLHLAWLVGGARIVCVKRMHPFHVLPERAVRVDHVNVVATLGVVRRGTELLATMEYVPGASLAEILDAARAGLDPRIAATIIRDVLRGIHAAHEHGLAPLPRGLARSNVLVAEHGTSKLLALDVSGPPATAATIEKLPYAAPEEISIRPRAVDRLRDVWAAGVLLWETVAGRSLFSAPTVAATLHAIQRKDVPAIHPALDPIVWRALARDPADRFDSALAMANELDHTSCASRDEVARALGALDLRCIIHRRRLADAVALRERSGLHIECTRRGSKG